MRKRSRWLGNGDGHVYEHVMTPPEDRTWGPLDCPSFVRINHPENWPSKRVAPLVYAKRVKVEKHGLLALALLVHDERRR